MIDVGRTGARSVPRRGYGTEGIIGVIDGSTVGWDSSLCAYVRVQPGIMTMSSEHSSGRNDTPIHIPGSLQYDWQTRKAHKVWELGRRCAEQIFAGKV